MKSYSQYKKGVIFKKMMFVYLVFPLLLVSASLVAHADVDYAEETSIQLGSQKDEALEDRVLFDELKIAFEVGALPMETPQDGISMEKIPEWAEGDVDKVKNYYGVHAESFLDQMLGGIASRFGVIFHGNMNQDELEANLDSFDIKLYPRIAPLFT